MSPDRLLELLLSDSPRWLGEAHHLLQISSAWIREGKDPLVADSPFLAFYRCIHAFKGACTLMAPRLPVAGRIAERLHAMEGGLAIKDRWKEAASWIPGFESDLRHIQRELHGAWQALCERACAERLELSAESPLPSSVRARSGERELQFPWASIIEFIPGVQVQGRPLVPVQGELLAVIPPQGPAHEGVRFGIAVRTQAGQKIVVPVRELELVFRAQSPGGADSGTNPEQASSRSPDQVA